MRRLIVSFLVFCMLITMNMATVAASDKDIANEGQILIKTAIMKDLTLDFERGKGTLDRGEAAVIVTRLMGKEQSAQNYKGTKYSAKDIKSIDKKGPYIEFVVKEGLIKLDSNGNYNSSSKISEKEFLVLMAKTLGYQEGIDFTYSNVYQFAYEKGIVKETEYKGKSFNAYSYSRKKAVKSIYNALTQKMKVNDLMLLTNLINSKMISKDYAIEWGILKDTKVTDIVQVNAIGNTVVSIKLNESIKKLDLKNISIHLKDDARNIVTSLDSITEDTIKVNTSGQTPNKQYIVEINDIEDNDGFMTKKLTSEFVGYSNYKKESDFFIISKVEVISKNVINVFFTQPVNMNSEMPMNYEIFKGNSSYIKGSFQSMSPKVLNKYKNCISIFLKEKDLEENVEYTLKINGSVPSVYGVKLNNGSGDSYNFIGKSSANTNFNIVSINVQDNRTVILEFSDEVDPYTAASASNYAVVGNGIPMYVNKAVVSANDRKLVKLSFINDLKSNITYEVSTQSIYDFYKQRSISVEKYPFVGTDTVREKINIVTVIAIDKGTVIVYFDRPIDPTSATAMGQYIITGPTSVAVAAISYDINEPYAVKLFLSTDSLISGGDYTLSVSPSVADETGMMFRTSATYNFSANSEENMKPILYDAKIIGDNAIKVSVTEDIKANGSNTIAANYSLEYKDGSNTKTKFATNVSLADPKTIIVFFDSLSNSTAYTLKFNSLTDFIGVNVRNSSDGLTSVSVSAGH